VTYTTFVKDILVCPETGAKLLPSEEEFKSSDGKTYKTIDGIMSIVYPDSISGDDKKRSKSFQ
jgi:hypothetical protein